MCWINLFGSPCNLNDRNIYDLTPIFGKKTVVSCRFCLIDPAAFYSAELYSYSECKSLSITLPVNRLNPLWSQPSTQDLNIQPFSTSDHFSIIRVLFGEMTSSPGGCCWMPPVAGCCEDCLRMPSILESVRPGECVNSYPNLNHIHN